MNFSNGSIGYTIHGYIDYHNDIFATIMHVYVPNNR